MSGQNNRTVDRAAGAVAAEHDTSPLARAWDAVAEQYDAYFGPRFEPWRELAVATLCDLASGLPPGRIIVPCCGPGRELQRLASAMPDRAIVGVDLSRRMVEMSRIAMGANERVTIEQGDASNLDRYAPVAAVISLFGLQQIPEPAVATGAWTRALSPGGVLVVVYWPRRDRDGGGPFDQLARLLVEHGEPAPADFDADLPAAVRGAGDEVMLHADAFHEMHHDSADALWEGLVAGGSWRSIADRKGAVFMERLRDTFLSQATPASAPIRHRVRARLIAARRPRHTR